MTVAYDPVARRQINLDGPFDTLAECIEDVNKQKHLWPKDPLYCLPAEVVPSSGTGLK
jgi:hypothetical protein